MFNEPGVATAIASSSIEIDGTVTSLVTRTIDCPSGGIIVAIGSGALGASQAIDAMPVLATFGVSDSPTLFSAGTTLLSFYPPPPDYYVFSITLPFQTVHIFQVPGGGGSYTFYFNAQTQNGTPDVQNAHLVLMYFPTAYGDVDYDDYLPVPSSSPEGVSEMTAMTKEPTANEDEAVTLRSLLETQRALEERVKTLEAQLASTASGAER
jgi:hypothetical protein